MKVYSFTVYKDGVPIDYFGGIEANDVGFATSLFRERAGISTFAPVRCRPKWYTGVNLLGITWTHTVKEKV